jgi:signal transduction histidine kinase
VKRSTIIFIAIFFQTFLFGTDKRYLDSCENVVLTIKDPHKKAYALYILSYENGLIEPRKGISYGLRCLRLSEEIGDLMGQLNGYNGIGNAYETMANYDSAIWHHLRSYEIANKLGKSRTIVAALSNVATCYKEQGKYKEALNTYIRAYKLVENEEEYNPRIHYYLGEIYYLLENYKLAEYHAKIGYEKCMKFDFEYVAYNMNIVLAKCKLKLGKIDSSIAILIGAQKKLKTYTDQLSYAICLNALAESYLAKHDFNNAKDVIIEELQIQEGIRNKNGICMANLNLAFCYANLKNRNDALITKYLNAAESGLINIKHNKDALMKVYGKIANTYELMGREKPALAYYKLYSKLKDELLNEAQYKQLHELQTKYESDKKEKQIKDQKASIENQLIVLERNRLQIILLLCTISFLLIFGYFIYNWYKLKQKTKLILEIQKQEQIREIALKEKENEERTRMAKDIHDELGSGLSKIKLISELIKKDEVQGGSINDKIMSISETSGKLVENMRDLIWIWNPDNTNLPNLIARIREYTYDYLEDFPIELTINSPTNIPSLEISNDVARNIYMIVKEILQNIVKHSKASIVKLNMQVDGVFIISIEDNGIGFDLSAVNSGFGLNNLRSRADKIGGHIFIDSKKGNGVIITLEIQVEKLKKNKIPL